MNIKVTNSVVLIILGLWDRLNIGVTSLFGDTNALKIIDH